MTKQLVSITVFICTVSVTITAHGKVDAYLVERASYSWTDSDLDNFIPDENDDLFNKPHSYFAYSLHDNEDSTNKEDSITVEEVVVPLSNLAELSSDGDKNNETEKSEEISNTKFMNDVHKLLTTLVEEGAIEQMPYEEEDQEQPLEVSVPLLDEELTFDPMKEMELFSLTVPETQKNATENRSQKELISSESNRVLEISLPKESSNEGFLVENLVQNQKQTAGSLRSDANESIRDIILEMDLFPVESRAPVPKYKPKYGSDFDQEVHLLPFVFNSRLPDSVLAHSSWHPLIHPPTSYMHRPVPSTKFHINSNGEVKYMNPRKILNSLKATSIGEMEYQPLVKNVFNSPIGFDDSAHVYGHFPYHHGDVSYGSLDLGSLLHGGISVNNWKEGKYIHKNPQAIVPLVEATQQLEVMMSPTKRLLRKMMVIEPPAVLRIEPVVCHSAYKHPQAHIVF